MGDKADTPALGPRQLVKCDPVIGGRHMNQPPFHLNLGQRSADLVHHGAVLPQE